MPPQERSKPPLSAMPSTANPPPLKQVNATVSQTLGTQTGGVTVGVMVGGKIVYYAPGPVIDLDEALVCLEQMPTALGASPPDPASLPTPHFMPLSRNPLFVGREADLCALARSLTGEGGVTAIGQIAASTGLGGIGKTNLATEFVHRYGQFFAGGVFWLSFAEQSTVPTDIARCGPTGLVQHHAWGELSLEEQIALVRHTWQQPVPRLLVFDNCEDEELLRAWRPTSGGCRVLITSRRAQWDASLGVAAIRLDTLARPESIALLCKHRPDLAPDNPILDAIAHELGDLPLALHLAGSYLGTDAHDTVLGDPAVFLSDLRSAEILAHAAMTDVDRTLSPTNHLLHVARTFSLSYDRLNPSVPVEELARDLLARAACLAPGEPIPHDLLLATVLDDEQDQADRRVAVRAIERLCAVGLLERVAGSALRMHRLVRRFTEQVSDMAAARDDVEQTVLELSEQLRESSNAPSILAARVHFRTVVDDALANGRAQASWLCNEVGLCLGVIGAHSEAKEFYERALETEAASEPLSQERAAILQNLAGALWDMGDYNGAKAVLEEVVRLDELLHGSEHPFTASSLNALATVLNNQGDYEGARPLHERALQIYEQTLGPTNPETAQSLNNLATLLQAQGEYEEARPLLERALQIYEQALGPTHPSTAGILNNLATLLQAQGEYEEARPLLERALQICEQALGLMHATTALTLNNLATLLQAQGEYEEARPLLERALQIYEQALGPIHPDTARSLNNLALLLRDQGEYEKARPLLERALQIYEQALGPTHPNTAQGLNNLAVLLQSQGENEEVRPLLERALQIYEQTLRPMHPQTAQSLSNLASLLQAQGGYEEARPLFERALEIYKQALGPLHPNTALGLNNLAGLLYEQDNLDKARPLFEQALQINEQVLGSTHPTTALSLRSLALVLRDQGDYTGAQLLFERALEIHERTRGQIHPTTAQGLNSLATVLYRRRDYERARPLLERALQIREQALGPTHIETAESLTNLAMVLRGQDNYDGARPLLERAVQINEQALGIAHPTTTIVRNNLAELLRKQQDLVSSQEVVAPPSSFLDSLLDRYRSTLKRIRKWQRKLP